MIDYRYLFKNSNNGEEASISSKFNNVKNLYLDLPLEKTNGNLDDFMSGFSKTYNIFGNGQKIQFINNLGFFNNLPIENINLSNGKFKDSVDARTLFYNSMNIKNLRMQNIVYPKDAMINFAPISSIENMNLYNWKIFSPSISGFISQQFNLKNLNMENWTIYGNKTYMEHFLQGCRNLENINLSTWKGTSNIYSLANSFNNCYGLKYADLSNGDAYSFNIGALNEAFNNCGNLINLKLDNGKNTNCIGSLINTFNNCRNLSNVNLASGNTSNLMRLDSTFRNCRNVFSGNFSTGDTSNLQSLENAFCDCIYGDINLGNGNFSNIRTLAYTFYDYRGNFVVNNNVGDCPNLFNLHDTFSLVQSPTVPKIICNNIENISECFYSSQVEELDLSQGNISKVSSFRYLFAYCQKLQNLNLKGGGKNTANLQNLDATFMWTNFPGSQETVEEIQNFNTSNVTNMNGTFCHGYVGDILNLSLGNVEKVNNMRNLFCHWQGRELYLQNGKLNNINELSYFLPINDTGNLEMINLYGGNFENSGLTNFSNFFNASTYNYFTNKLNYLDVNNGTGLNNIKSLENIFSVATINSLDLSTGELPSCSDLNYMFRASNIDIEGLPNFNYQIPVNAAFMFYNGQGNGNLNFRNICFSNVTNMFTNIGIYYNHTINFDESLLSPTCSSLANLFSGHIFGSINNGNFLSNWNTSKVNNMAYMFDSFNMLNLKDNEFFNHLLNLNTSSLTNITSLFANHYNTNYINLSSGDVNNVSSFSYTFYGGYLYYRNNQRGPAITIDLSEWKSRYSTLNGAYCFANCNLKDIYLNSFKFNTSMNFNNAFNNISGSCNIGVRDNAAKQILSSKVSSLQNIFIAAPLAMDRIESYSMMNTRSANLSIEFYGGSSDITNQQLSCNVTSTSNEIIQINSSTIDYTNSIINIEINSLSEGTDTINITLSDTQGNTSTQSILITITEYIPQFYEVEAILGAAYTFELNSNAYYESKNKGVNSSYAICKLKFRTDTGKLILDCINSGESNYDFGILSTIDNTLSLSSSADSTNVYKSFKGQSSYSIQTQTYTGLDTGDHFIYIKYRKDSSGNSGKDSLQFKVRFE